MGNFPGWGGGVFSNISYINGMVFEFIMFITAVCVLSLIKLRWPNNKSRYDTVFEPFWYKTGVQGF